MGQDKVKVIDKEGDFAGLRDQWNDLLAQSDADSIFLSWEWINTWWGIFKGERKLYILTCWEKDELVGIAPLLVREAKYYGLLKYRRIEFLASGEDEADEICSEYLNVIIRKGMEEQVIEGIIDHLYNNHEWDEVILKELVAGNKSTAVLLDRLKARDLKHTVAEDDAAPYIELPPSWESLMGRLDSDLRYKIRRDRRKLSEKGSITITQVSKAGDVEAAFDRLMNLHQARWEKVGKRGCFSSQKFTQFHKQMIPGLFQRRQVRLLFLEIDNRPVAALYELIYNHKVLYYQSGFDVAYDPKLSLGNILRAYSIEKAIGEGFKEYDFLKGTDKRHCREWSSNEKKIIRIRIYKKDLKEHIYSFILAGKRIVTKTTRLLVVRKAQSDSC